MALRKIAASKVGERAQQDMICTRLSLEGVCRGGARIRAALDKPYRGNDVTPHLLYLPLANAQAPIAQTK